MVDLLSKSPRLAPENRITDADLRAAIRKRYGGHEWVCCNEVGNSGSSSSVRIDMVAMNMWQSKGYALEAFEIKVSRSDWLREMKQPEKADKIMGQVERFWLVAPEGVAKPDEIPSTWGYLRYCDNGELRQVVKAPTLEAKPIGRGFVAQMLRRANSNDTEAMNRIAHQIADGIMERERERHRSEVEGLKQRKDSDGERYRNLMKRLDARYVHDDDIVRVFRLVIATGVGHSFKGVAGLLDTLRKNQKDIEEAIEKFKLGEPVAEEVAS
jgi:hypothetical protein